nr:hypothetical protein [uncultured bacterium]
MKWCIPKKVKSNRKNEKNPHNSITIDASLCLSFTSKHKPGDKTVAKKVKASNRQ